MNAESKAMGNIMHPKVVETVAKQLWPTMLFLVVMSIISLVGSRWWGANLESQIHMVLSYWLWFVSMMVITGFGVYVFQLDARIQLHKD